MIETPAEILSHHADKDAAASFVKWRKAIKAPLTERAAVRIAKSLAEIRDKGGDPTEALDLAQEHGWRSIKPQWYFTQCPPKQPTPRQSSDLDKMAEAIKSGMPYLCKDISASAARHMVERGMVTREQCQKVSVPL